MIKNLFFIALFFVSLEGFSQTVIFNEDFESKERRDLWTLIDRDGDGTSWEYDNSPLDAFTGYTVTSWSWFLEALTPDNLLISPVISLPKNSDKKLSLKFDVGTMDDEELFEEHYAVYVIPANVEFIGSEEAVFEETLDKGYATEAKHIDIDVSEYAGQDVQFIFRHYNSSNVMVLIMDNVQVLEETKLSISDANKSKVVVYQDEKNGLVKVSGLTDVKRMKIFDVTGKFVMEVHQSEANISSLPKGIYIVNFYTGDHVVSRKIVKK